MTREYREAELQHLTQTIDGLCVILRLYKQAAGMPAKSKVSPGTTSDDVIRAILDHEFPRAAAAVRVAAESLDAGVSDDTSGHSADDRRVSLTECKMISESKP